MDVGKDKLLEMYRSMQRIPSAPMTRVTALEVPILFSPPLQKAEVPDESRTDAGIRAVLRR